MKKRRLHVIKVPTNNQRIFPYSHYNDVGHDPYIIAQLNDRNDVILTCQDIFKLKPNVQVNPKTRVDIYMPGLTGMELGNDILRLVGVGNIAELSNVNPEDFRKGPQTLPLIDESRSVRHQNTNMNIAGTSISGEFGSVYIDRERPNEGHIEMKGPEIHIGIPLLNVFGSIDLNYTSKYNVPVEELRVSGESNPVTKADGVLSITFNKVQAQNLAATLLYYTQQ